MKYINVRVITNASFEKVEPIKDKYVVHVKAKPESGKANNAVLKVLARYLGVSRKSLCIKTGKSRRDKLIQVKD